MNDWKDKYIDRLVEGLFDFFKPKTQAQKNLPISRRTIIINDQRPNSTISNKDTNKDDTIPYEKPTNKDITGIEVGYEGVPTEKEHASFRDQLDRITNPRKYAKPDNKSNERDPSKKRELSLVTQETSNTERRKNKADMALLPAHNEMGIR
jgi:hypothetical protein